MKRIISIIPLIVVLASCGINDKVVVDYTITADPQEKAGSFQAITTTADDLTPPIVISWEKSDQKGGGASIFDSKILQWDGSTVLAVSPNGREIAYLSERNHYTTIFKKSINRGTSKEPMTFNRMVHTMSYSPDGQRMIFSEWLNNQRDIFSIPINKGMSMDIIAKTSADEHSPVYSKDGRSVFFVKEIKNRRHIYSFSFINNRLTEYTEGYQPVIDSSNKLLYFIKNNPDNGMGELMQLNLDSGQETIVFSNPSLNIQTPDISPDGNYLVFVGATPKDEFNSKKMNLDLYLVRPDGSGWQQLTFHGGHDLSPRWSPDGRSIFFLSQRGTEKGEYNIWKIDVDR